MIKTQIALQQKRHYTAPEAELILLGKGNNLLTTLSGDIEAWEDDEIITPQG